MFGRSHCCGEVAYHGGSGWWKIIQLMVVQKRKKGLRFHKRPCQKTLLVPALLICMYISICRQLEAREQLQVPFLRYNLLCLFVCLFVFDKLSYWPGACLVGYIYTHTYHDQRAPRTLPSPSP